MKLSLISLGENLFGPGFEVAQRGLFLASFAEWSAIWVFMGECNVDSAQGI